MCRTESNTEYGTEKKILKYLNIHRRKLSGD